MRPHTGRRRNEAARTAALDAALAILADHGYGALSMERIARVAAVSKQTLYRWWPSPAAIVLEAVTERAIAIVDAPSTDDPRADVEAFLVSTYQGAAASAPFLRALAAAAQSDPAFAESFHEFTARRRAALREPLERAGGDDLGVDIAFGVLWYRLLNEHAPVDAAAGREVAARILPPVEG